MSQGFLRMLVLQQVSQEPTSGYTIVKVIHEKTGWKPSYGSIYPLLQSLEKDNLVTVKEEGKRKLYTCTSAGKQYFATHNEKASAAFKQIIEQLKVIHSLGHEEMRSFIDILEANQHSGTPAFQDPPEASLVRTELARLIREGKMISKRKEVSTIILKTVKELKKL